MSSSIRWSSKEISCRHNTRNARPQQIRRCQWRRTHEKQRFVVFVMVSILYMNIQHPMTLWFVWVDALDMFHTSTTITRYGRTNISLHGKHRSSLRLLLPNIPPRHWLYEFSTNPLFIQQFPPNSQKKKYTNASFQWSWSTQRTARINEEEENEDEDEDDDEEEDDEEDAFSNSQETFQKSSFFNNNKKVLPTFGLGKGRSSPAHRKAMSKANTAQTVVYCCTNCASEFVQWVGKCPTCQEWNTVQEFFVSRSSSSTVSSPSFPSSSSSSPSSSSSSSSLRPKNNRFTSTHASTSSPSSWLPASSFESSSFSSFSSLDSNTPIPITDILQRYHNPQERDQKKPVRMPIPMDPEFTTVLGGGFFPGSLLLLGGDPGVGKSTLLLQTAFHVASMSSPSLPGKEKEEEEEEEEEEKNQRPETSSNLDKKWPQEPDKSPTQKNRKKIQNPNVLYVSGEETVLQIASRAQRLGLLTQGDMNQMKRKQYTNKKKTEKEEEIHLYPNKKSTPSSAGSLLLLCETDADKIAHHVLSNLDPYSISSQSYPQDQLDTQPQQQQSSYSLIVIDSIQTMYCDTAGSSSVGSITQVRECVGVFLRLAKSTGIPIILIGHVTKSGGVAGPRTVEHMVDAVLYLEGMSSTYGGSGVGSTFLSGRTHLGSGLGGSNLRMLRAVKNRFGSADEVGVYEMIQENSRFMSLDEDNYEDDKMGNDHMGHLGGGRLVPVSDPSALFLSLRQDAEDVEGCAVSIIMEGKRAMTVEVQALVARVGGGSSSSYAGRRTVDGIATSRLLLILAVLQKRCELSFSRQDVYVNVVGGIRLNAEKQHGSGSDLAVALALVSSLYGIPIRSDTAFVGEIGLLGELRPVVGMEKRIHEARRMGFSRVITPKIGYGGNTRKGKPYSATVSKLSGIEHIQCVTLMDAVRAGLVRQLPKKRQAQRRIGPNHDNLDKNVEMGENGEKLFIIDDEGDDIDDEDQLFNTVDFE